MFWVILISAKRRSVHLNFSFRSSESDTDSDSKSSGESSTDNEADERGPAKKSKAAVSRPVDSPPHVHGIFLYCLEIPIYYL